MNDTVNDTESVSKPISSVDSLERVDHLLHPLAVQVSNLLTRSGRIATRQIIIDDEQNILQFRGTGAEVQRVFLSEDHGLSPAEVRQFAGDAPSSVLARRTSKKIFGNERLSRVFAIAQMPEANSLKALPRVSGDILVLDNLKIAGNIGAIIRTGFAFKAGAIVLLDYDPVDLYDRRTIRASRGYIFHLPIVCCSTSELVDFLKSESICLVATSASGSRSVEDIAIDPRQYWIALGAEKEGCAPALKACALEEVRIPMQSEAESLNVSVAASILLYVRSRRLFAQEK